MRSASASSCGWLCVITRKYAPSGAAATSASGVSVVTQSTLSGDRRGKGIVARVDPPDSAVDAGEGAHHRTADVPGTEKHDSKIGRAHDVDENFESVAAPERHEPRCAVRRDRAGERRGLVVVAPTQRSDRRRRGDDPRPAAASPRTGVTSAHSTPSVRSAADRLEPGGGALHGLEQKLRHAAAALAQARAQRKAMERPARRREQAPRDLDRLVFEVAAAYRADDASAVTTIRVPGARGTEPFAATMLTSTAPRPEAAPAASARIQSLIGTPLAPPRARRRSP